MIKKLLLATLAVLALQAYARAEETTVLWEGEVTLSWDESTAPHITAAEAQNARIIAGDKIYLTFSEISSDVDWPSCYLRSVDEVELCGLGLWDYKTSEMPLTLDVEVPYDAKVVKAFKNGFMAVGTGAVITKIAVEHSGDPSVILPEGDNVLWFGPAEQIAWSNIDISADKAKDIAVGDYINFTVDKLTEGSDWPKIVVTDNDWKQLTEIDLWNDRDAYFPMVKSLIVTADNLESIHSGFHVGGDGWWCTLVDYTHGDPMLGLSDISADEPAAVDVYTIQGILLKRSVMESEALEGLPSGLYIVGGKKIFK